MVEFKFGDFVKGALLYLCDFVKGYILKEKAINTELSHGKGLDP